MIYEITRGHIIFGFMGKRITIQGEAFLPGRGSPDFVIYSNSIEAWDPPDGATRVDSKTKRRILEALIQELRERNISAEIE